jgi:hypothetical protein
VNRGLEADISSWWAKDSKAEYQAAPNHVIASDINVNMSHLAVIWSFICRCKWPSRLWVNNSKLNAIVMPEVSALKRSTAWF